MVISSLRTYAWMCVLPLSAVAHSQFTLSPEDTGVEGKSEIAAVGGRTAFDLIAIKEGKFSFPLRFGHLVANSERVDLDGRSLTKGKDYTVDYPSGVIYLRVAVRDGMSLRVQYRYDETKKKEGTYGMAFAGGMQNFRFQFSPGGHFVLGMGQTERLADGTVITSNVYGLQNSFQLNSGTKVSGVFMVGEREKATATDLLGHETGKGSDIEEGTGTAIVQSVESKALGGTVKLDYQAIDDKFAGFNSLRESGMDEKQVAALQNERGLKRTGFGFNGIGSPAFNFSQGYQTVGDAAGGITWRSYGMNALGVSAAWSSQYVDPTFNAFNKLREEDRGQLAKERGLDRQTFSLSSKLAGDGKFGFDNLTVSTRDGQDLIRQSLSIDTKGFKGSYMDQRVDEGFTRFGDLREQDRGQLAKERGMSRQGWGFTTGIGGMNLSTSSSVFGRGADGILSQDFGIGSKRWSVNYSVREIDKEFTDFGALTNEDRQSQVAGALGLYDTELKPHGNDMNGLGGQAGFRRSGLRMGYAEEGGWAAKFQRIMVDGFENGLRLDQIDLSKAGTTLSIRNLNSDDDFADFGRLYWNEQRLLGRVDGLDKFDLNFATKIGKGMGLSVNHMDAESPMGGARRDLFSLSGATFKLDHARRSVDDGFTNVGAMADPEAKDLSGLVGFDQSQTSGFWQLMPNLRFDFNEARAVSSIYDQAQMYQEARVGWSLSSKTSLSAAQVNRSFTDGDANTIDQKYQQLQVRQDLGKSGKVTVTQEQHRFDGKDDTLPDAVKQTLSYETKISKNTDFKTEQSVTRFDNGERETSSSNTVATKLSDRVGVSVTDTKILRDGDAKDETRRDYGFWVDFGGGIRLDYQYKRNMVGEDFGQHQTGTTLSGGTAGNLKIDGASYRHNRLDDKRDTHWGNVSFSNVNPFAIGAMKDIKFYYRTDTERDFVAWKKENLGFGLSSSLGQFGLGYDYSSQIHPNGFRAIDRVFTLKTDKDDTDRLRGTLKYGARTLPDDDYVVIRDYSLTYDASKNFSLQHAVVTNPTQQKNDVLLGSVPLDERRNSWTMKYQNDKNWMFDLGWNEIKRDQLNESLRREARLNMTLMANSGSPLQFSYALQQWNRNSDQRLSQAFGLSFFQQPGPNQSFAFSLEHLNWTHGRPDNSRDWQFRLDYSLRF